MGEPERKQCLNVTLTKVREMELSMMHDNSKRVVGLGRHIHDTRLLDAGASMGSGNHT